MIKTDSIDEQIVRLLGQDGRQTSDQIAKQLNISAATVRRRIKKLVDNDLLHFVGVVDPANFGYTLPAVIAIDVAPNKLEVVLTELEKLKEVEWIAPTVGRYDIIAGLLLRSMDDLSEFLQNTLPHIDGVKDNEVFICLKGKKRGYLQVLS
ncbi:MAG: Lrp/AsnC family transcriptional regulator [Dehalococcoidales bacterium]|nr:Lrp/AsnC family transcriptional regulator [Dehalococcoidales bacterium]